MKLGMTLCSLFTYLSKSTTNCDYGVVIIRSYDTRVSLAAVPSSPAEARGPGQALCKRSINPLDGTRNPLRKLHRARYCTAHNPACSSSQNKCTMADEKPSSPARLSISGQISAMGTKLGRALGKDGSQDRLPNDNRNSVNTLVDDAGEFNGGISAV
jgi:hypothetical protein